MQARPGLPAAAAGRRGPGYGLVVSPTTQQYHAVATGPVTRRKGRAAPWYSRRVAHLTVAGPAQHVEVIDGSRFLGFVWPITELEEAQELLAEVRRQHPEATHHCWAYRLAETQRFSDDGEPGGTAGRPMLEVLLKRDLNMVLAVVVRYYGGRKLGAGGLVRAYAGTVAKTLDLAGERAVVDMVTLQLAAPFALTDTVLRSVDELVAEHEDASRGQARFDGQGLLLELSLPLEDAEQAILRLTEVTRGDIRVSSVEELSDP